MLRIVLLMPLWLSIWLFLAPFYVWWATNNWVPVDAVVTYSQVLSKPVRRGGPLTKLVTHYSYSYQGQNYLGYRSGLDRVDAYDSSDRDWKQERVRTVGTKLTAYVNPKNPANSLVFREFRWGALGRGLGFVLVWGLSWWTFFGRRAQDDIAQESSQFVSRRMVVVFNAIGWLSLAAVWPRLIHGWSPAWWMVIFPVAGLYLAYLRWQQAAHREVSTQEQANAAPPHSVHYGSGEVQSKPWSELTLANASFAALVLFSLWWQFPRSFDGLATEAARIFAASDNHRVQKSAIEQFQRDGFSGSRPFALEDSAFLFVALGSGSVSLGTQGFSVSSDALRIQFRSDCPSALCAPIQSLQWLLVVPRDKAKPDGAWMPVAQSIQQPIDFRPQTKNDQLVLPAQQATLRVVQAGDLAQARLMVALRNSQNISTYSQSQRIWALPDSSGEPVARPNEQRTHKSLYAALFYADGSQVRQHIAQGASVHETYDSGMGALHVAASSGCSDCIAALVAAGAKIDYKVPSYRQENALMMAIRSRQAAAAQKLLDLGADPCQSDREGYDAQGWVKFYGLQSSFGFVPVCKN